MAFRSSDALVILLRKLPERGKTRPSKFPCNSSLCPLVSKIGRQVHGHHTHLNPKIRGDVGNICKRYLQYGAVSLPNLTTNQYIIFEIFYRSFLRLPDMHIACSSIYAHSTCVALVVVLCRGGEVEDSPCCTS